MSEMTHDDVRQIIELVDAAGQLDESDIAYGGFRLHLRRSASGDVGVRANLEAPAAIAVPAAVVAPTATKPSEATRQPLAEGMVAVRSPMLGTFYRSPAPGEDPFTQVGARVKAEDTVCLIEVMKLFNSIRAGIDGTVAEIAVENGSLVEYDQVVILIDTNKKG